MSTKSPGASLHMHSHLGIDGGQQLKRQSLLPQSKVDILCQIGKIWPGEYASMCANSIINL